MYILGIHGSFGRAEHDAAAAIIKDGVVIAAAEEERFTRSKHAIGVMPTRAIQYCLHEAGITMQEIDRIAFPRSTWDDFDPRFKAYLWYTFGAVPQIEYIEHHLAHAASAYYISGFSSSLVMTFDQSGDGVSCAVFRGEGTTLTPIESIPFPNSLGLFAAYMTQYLGFQSNHDEYKVMGLAAYGTPQYDLTPILTSNHSKPHFDSSFLHPEVLQRHPIFHTEQLPMMKDEAYDFMPPRRQPGSDVTAEYKDLAASAQQAIERVIQEYVTLHAGTAQQLCLAGGVAENSVSNGKLALSGLFQDIYIAPACGDAGTALGAALYIGVQAGFTYERMGSNKLGPSYDDDAIEKLLKDTGVSYHVSTDTAQEVAALLEKQYIVAWFQGRMEFGPRALGARSLLADPSRIAMKKRVNSIKRREQFRPFAPSVLAEHADTLFQTAQSSPFMSFTLPTTAQGRKQLKAATHVDDTGRLQTVAADGSKYRLLIEAFFERTGIPALLNTSLNSGWEPIVESPEQALAFFFSSEADVLVLHDYIIEKQHA